MSAKNNRKRPQQSAKKSYSFSSKPQQNKGKSGGGGGGGKSALEAMKEIESLRRKDAANNRNHDSADDENSEQYTSGLERFGGLMTAIIKAFGHTKWESVVTGQLLNVLAAIHESTDVVKKACERLNTTEWSQFASLLKAMGMQPFDPIDFFFKPNPNQNNTQDPNHDQESPDYDDKQRDFDRHHYGDNSDSNNSNNNNNNSSNDHEEHEWLRALRNQRKSDGEYYHDDHHQPNSHHQPNNGRENNFFWGQKGPRSKGRSIGQ